MNNFERFNEEKIPARKNFFSSTKKGKIDNDGKISDGHVSIKDYLTCEVNWDKFEMKNMVDYHDHYLKRDVLLLADVFEKFIVTCLKCYELDPCHYFSWDFRIKLGCHAKDDWHKIRKISDINMYFFVEETGGGISYIAKRYAKANNKYINDYDPEMLSTFIAYLDKNNLYGWEMSKYLPYGKR